MQSFTKTIHGIGFSFQPFLEGKDEVCRVSVDGQSFKMTVGESGDWEILQQVPSWIKKLEKDLAEAVSASGVLPRPHGSQAEIVV